MVGRDLLGEFAHFEKQIRMMLTYAVGVKFNVSPVRVGPEQWPPKPNLS
jgi:hypothetical protein